ncbi:MAG: hypothetical protein PF436_12045 [Prolixibacteraceae bacterium]|jgi:hypothetical protein|nr:hypothetical protein [Prolixibacteraceae bacterium]
MRTSKTILIVFLSLVGLFLLSLLIQVDPKKQKPQLEKKAIALPPFKHLVLLNSNNVKLKQAETDSAWVLVKVDSLAILPEFVMKSDTLVLTWPHNENNWNRTIACSDLKTISVENSQVNINNMHVDSLSFFAVKGNIFLEAPRNMDYLQINLEQNSFIRVDGQGIKTIEAEASESKAEIWLSQTEALKAHLRNHSNLSTNQVLKTEVETDASSRYYSR